VSEPIDPAALLREGAAAPRSTLDVEAVVQRGAARRGRRRSARVGALAGLLLVVAGTGVWVATREPIEPAIVLAPGPSAAEPACVQDRRLGFDQYAEGPLLDRAFADYVPPQHPHQEGAQPAILKLRDPMVYAEARDAATRLGPAAPDELVLAAYIPTVETVWLALWRCQGERGGDLLVALDPTSGDQVSRASTDEAFDGPPLGSEPRLSDVEVVLLRGMLADEAYAVTVAPDAEGQLCLSVAFPGHRTSSCGRYRAPPPFQASSQVLEEEDPDAYRYLVHGVAESGTALVAAGTDLPVRAPATAQPTHEASGRLLYAVEAAQGTVEVAAYDASGARLATISLRTYPATRVRAAQQAIQGAPGETGPLVAQDVLQAWNLSWRTFDAVSSGETGHGVGVPLGQDPEEARREASDKFGIPVEEITIEPVQRVYPPAGVERTPELLGRTTTYVVVPGDSYQAIARKVYGDPDRYHDILAANGLAGTEELEVGQELVIALGPRR
jgi:nucleoid-associated protein YgaU